MKNPLLTSILETERLLLRPMTEEDAPIVVKWRNSPHIASMSDESASGGLTLDDHLRWFEETRSKRLDYMVLTKSHRHPIGSVSYTWRVLPDVGPAAELGKYIGELSALGKGFGYEMARQWIRFALENINLAAVFAKTRRSNLANIKINHKLGFFKTPWPSVWENPGQEWLFMILKRTDWEEMNTKTR